MSKRNVIHLATGVAAMTAVLHLGMALFYETGDENLATMLLMTETPGNIL